MSTTVDAAHAADTTVSAPSIIRIDETWINRLKNFIDTFMSQISLKEINRQFNNSDYRNINDFIHLNSLHFIEMDNFMFQTRCQFIDESSVLECYRRSKYDQIMSLSTFCHRQNIAIISGGRWQREGENRSNNSHQNNNDDDDHRCPSDDGSNSGTQQKQQQQQHRQFVKVTNTFPKMKLLEIIVGLNLFNLVPDEIVTIDILDDMMGSRLYSLQFILMLFVAGFAKIVTINEEMLTYNGIHSLHLANHPIGIFLEKGLDKVLVELTQMSLDYLVEKQDKLNNHIDI